MSNSWTCASTQRKDRDDFGIGVARPFLRNEKETAKIRRIKMMKTIFLHHTCSDTAK